MTSGLVLVEQSAPAVLRITLNRPQKRNALSIALMDDLCETLVAVRDDRSERVIVLQGAGPVFCSGLDLEEAADPERSSQSAELVARMLSAVCQAPQLMIAAVQGAAIAGGAGLMAACDFAIATEDCRFGFPEVQRGIVPALVMALLRRRLRDGDARELFLLAELIDAHRAREMRLIHKVTSVDRLGAEIEDVIQRALLGAPGAIQSTKRLWEELWPWPLGDDFEHALGYHRQSRDSAEAKEGIAAFLEKRKPHWNDG